MPKIDIDGLVETISLEQDNAFWAQRVLDFLSQNKDFRKSRKKEVAAAMYDINVEVEKLQAFYE